MVQSPKCKVCGSAHWSNEPHRWVGDAVSPPAPGGLVVSAPKKVAGVEIKKGVALAPVVGASSGDDKDAMIALLRSRIERLEEAADQAERRRAYQRELMAKRRAEKGKKV